MILKFEDLVGQTLTNVEGKEGGDEIVFTLPSGKKVYLNHSQECCESVYILDINGDLSDLVGSPILQAEESTSQEPQPDYPEDKTNFDSPVYYGDSYTWTFYKLATIKGSVTIRWFGSSNGYYSESVDFVGEGGSRFWAS